MSVCVLIPARGGSKGIQGKNIKFLGGKPLIQYTLDAARACFTPEQIVVSTDDIEIKKVVEELGQPICALRPESLAQDDTPTAAVITYELEQWRLAHGSYPEHVVLLQATSPFRSGDHLGEAWERYRSNRADMLLSVCASKQNPYYNLFEEQNGYLQKSKEGAFTRRQDCPPVWELNGAIYIFRIDRFLELGIEEMDKIKYEMSEIDSIDIDSPLDWIIAECLISLKS
jgi:CMP-N,N'-diacetyllegionaminic acid synthase